METTKKYNVNIKKLDNSEVEIETSLPWEEVSKYRDSVIKSYAKNLKLDGFRPGKVPESVVAEKVGEDNIISDMAEKALQKAYPEIVKENDLNVIGAPKINVTKIAENNPLEFKITTAIMPEVKLPDYKKIAKEINSKPEEIKVEEAEVEHAIKHIKEQWVRSEKVQDLVNGGKKIEEVDPRSIEIKEEELPALDDDFVKKVGKFENVDDFKTKLRENMIHEKTLRAKEKKRAEMLDKIALGTEVFVPEIVIEGEINRMMAQFQSDVTRAGLKFEDYLKQTDKKEEDLRKEWHPDAEKYAKNQMVLNKIAIEEDIVPKKEDLEAEVDKIMANYKDANRDRATIYVETLMTNDLIFAFLEKQVEKTL